MASRFYVTIKWNAIITWSPISLNKKLQNRQTPLFSLKLKNFGSCPPSSNTSLNYPIFYSNKKKRKNGKKEKKTGHLQLCVDHLLLFFCCWKYFPPQKRRRRCGNFLSLFSTRLFFYLVTPPYTYNNTWHMDEEKCDLLLMMDSR